MQFKLIIGSLIAVLVTVALLFRWEVSPAGPRATMFLKHDRWTDAVWLCPLMGSCIGMGVPQAK